MVLLVASTLAASPQPASTAKSRVYPSKCLNDIGEHGGKLIFPELRRLGVRAWSTGLSWAATAPTRPVSATAPTDPAYQWPAGLDAQLRSAVAHRIEPILYVNGFPAWSNGGRDQSWVAVNPKDYADFMVAAMRRYPQVRRWVAFSEPGNSLNFKPQGGRGKRAPRLYARLLDAAYAAMHAVRNNVVVIGGNVHVAGRNDHTGTAPDTFLQQMILPSGRRPRMDMFGINPFTERPLNMALPHRPGRVDFNDLDWLVRQLDRHWPGRRLQLFIDEFGWNTEHEAIGWLYVVSRQKQAANLTKAYRLAARLGRVDTMCWFQLYDSPPYREGSTWLNWTSGLRTYDGAPKPSWRAFARIPSGKRRVG